MLTVLSVAEAKEKILTAVLARTEQEPVLLTAATGRTLAQPVAAEEDLPSFARSTMDGFAVRAQDTYGASEAMPALFDVKGEILMGQAPEIALAPGQALRISTGGMLPADSDAVAMVEHTEMLGGNIMALSIPVAPGENIIVRGEDLLSLIHI